MSKTQTTTDLIQGLQKGLVLSLVLLLSACGFQLRGADSIPESYRHLRVAVPGGTPLESWIRAELIAHRVTLDESGTPRLHVLAVRPTRNQLVGYITEVSVGVEVDFQLEDAQGAPLTAVRTVIARRSYQYDINTVGIQSQQEERLTPELYQDAAQQIIRQLATGRLPAVS
jgi:LPS-assembly lipoprotein